MKRAAAVPARKLAFIFAAAFSFALLLGCVQTSVPKSCAALASADAANCVYTQAVLEQNPFYCYSITDMALRSNCMRHATDPVEKKRLENSQRQGIAAQQPPVAPAPAVEPPPSIPAGPAAQCDGQNGTSRDECFKADAISSSDLLACLKVESASLKQSCVSQVALSTKDVESCVNLGDKALRDVCRTYAKGETPSG